MDNRNIKYKRIIGVDQSLSNTGIAVIDPLTLRVVELGEFNSKPKPPDFVNFKEFFTIQRGRIQSLVDSIMNLIDNVRGDDAPSSFLVCIENLAKGGTGRTQNKDTEYLLGYLFSTLIDRVDEGGYHRIIVAPTTHKKAFFPSGGGNKEEMYAKYWDDCFILSDFTCDIPFKSLDQKDGFCLAYFGFVMFSCDLEEIFMYRSAKTRKIGLGKLLEAVRGQVCAEWKRVKLCWRCPVYLSCKEKKRYKLPRTKKDKIAFQRLKAITDKSIYNLFVNTGGKDEEI